MATEQAMQMVPEEVLCGPYRYTISFDSEAAYDYNYAGVALFRSKRIKLDPRQSDTEISQTLLHEILHVLGNTYEIREWDRHTHDDKGNVTDKIDLMASSLLVFLRNNPRVVQWLVGKEEK